MHPRHGCCPQHSCGRAATLLDGSAMGCHPLLLSPQHLEPWIIYFQNRVSIQTLIYSLPAPCTLPPSFFPSLPPFLPPSLLPSSCPSLPPFSPSCSFFLSSFLLSGWCCWARWEFPVKSAVPFLPIKLDLHLLFCQYLGVPSWALQKIRWQRTSS